MSHANPLLVAEQITALLRSPPPRARHLVLRSELEAKVAS